MSIDTWVTCPTCKGEGRKDCCDNEGIVPGWVVEAMKRGFV